MKQIIYLNFLLFSLVFCGCSLFSDNGTAYHYYKGFIGSNAVSMHLHQNEHQFSGTYWYDRIGKPIHIYGEDTSSMGNIILKTFDYDGISETLILRKADDKITGTWVSEKSKSRHLDIVLNEVMDMFEFGYFATDSTYTVKSGDMESTCTYEASLVWPKWDDAMADLLRSDIQKSFDEEGSRSSDPQSLIAGYRDAYIAEFISMADSMKNEPEYLMSRELQTRVQVLYQSKNILCTHTNFYQYDGGAHGLGGDFYAVYDVKQKRRIEVSDVISATGFRRLPQLIERQIKRDRGISAYGSLEDAGLFPEGVQQVSENFYLTHTGIGFVYLPYDIGPYSSGEFDVFISYTTIKKYLLPSFKARIGIR